MCIDEIIIHLTWIFQACNDLGYHLPDFKDSITIVIKKPGKPDNHPKSYRPIALLNAIAKLYERLLANRLKDVIIRRKMLPRLQFGAPGRNTTLAIENLTNYVYSAWQRDELVSLLGLDLTGAYDHVDRIKLLDDMVRKEFPGWLIKAIWSFLSDRRTYIHMPGYEGPEYWIDVGLPQGSPLSYSHPLPAIHIQGRTR
ncbi:unnamed protein product [Alternaria burnsii]|nr:unnamed protein product [Alternaria burnsii]